MAPPRIAYVQYTNPAAYPPLMHSSRILADDGWEVLFLGTDSFGEPNPRLEPHPRIQSERWAYHEPGVGQKLHYLGFAAWALRRITEWRAQWCYASDPWSSPIALMAGVPRIYHEHDTPSDSTRFIRRLVLHARGRLANRAALCVLPNEARRAAFAAQFPDAMTIVVLNCPMRDEIPPADRRNGELILYYHGSLVPERLPDTVVSALSQLPASVRFRFAGYETIGSIGYAAHLLTRAHALGVADRVEYLGKTADRSQLLAHLRSADVGLALVPREAADFNLRTMAGASNKPFEYLAAGLPLLVTDRPEWRSMFVDDGFGIACQPADAASIANAVEGLLNAPQERASMGQRGRQRVLREWNYEQQFEPVRSLLQRSAV